MTIQDKPIPKSRHRRRRHRASTVLARCSPSVCSTGEQNADRILDVDDSDPATRGVQLLAQAYGAGQSFERAGARFVLSSSGWEPTDPRTGEGDESTPAASPGLTLVRETETLLQAGRAINEKDREQKKLLARSPAEEVEAARQWSESG